MTKEREKCKSFSAPQEYSIYKPSFEGNGNRSRCKVKIAYLFTNFR